MEIFVATGKSLELVPYGEMADQTLDLILDTLSKSKGVGLKQMLDGDSSVLSRNDMLYFDGSFFGKVPSYGVFVRYLNKLPDDVRDNFNEVVSEIESARYIQNMDSIATMDNESLSKDSYAGKRFNWFAQLERVHSKKLDRIDRRRKERGVNVERTVDLAAKIIGALSDRDLINLKGRVEAIDAEYKDVTVAGDGE